MGINVAVVQKRQIHTSTNATSTALVTANPITLKTDRLQSLAEGATLLTQLQDIDFSQEVDGATLVYDESRGIFVAKLLDVSESTQIDGGTF